MNDNVNTIAVLIANYNNARFLRGALESVYSQSYPNWKIIICDDCSKDNSSDIFSEVVDDERINIIRNEKNMGVAYTRKRMIDETDCELLCFLDPDDELTPNALEDHVRVHLEHPEVSIIFSRRYLCDENLKVQEESRVLCIPEGMSYFTMKDFREEHLVSFKKSYYDKTSGINPLYKLAEDTHMNVMMEEVGRPYCLDKICYKYRRNGNSLTRDYGRHMFWNMLVQYDTCKRRGIDIESQVYDWYKKTVEFSALEIIYQKEQQVRSSTAYRIGNAILKPIKWIWKIWKK